MGIWGFGFRVEALGSGCIVYELSCRVEALGYRVKDLGSKVEGSKSGV